MRNDIAARAARVAAITREVASWVERRDRAQDRIGEIEERLDAARDEEARLAGAPDAFIEKRRALMSALEEAEAARRDASDARAEAESRLAECDRAARAALEAMSAAREALARSEAQLEGAKQRVADVEHDIAHSLETTPAALMHVAELREDDELPELAEIEKKLEQLKGDRERLGAVNLRADDELAEIEAQREKMIAERDDLAEAIKKLRAAIASLNKEGRERLLAAFDQVNTHFKELFTLLFDGGSAELQLVESDDPLEAGLDIL
ncbi:MAG: chromosome segregation protein SMC, partial [Methylocystis sp.]|nr:chromosome segregation protein SMC [Methylocystis sp.]